METGGPEMVSDTGSTKPINPSHRKRKRADHQNNEQESNG